MSGERIETAGDLDALPVGSVVIDVGPDRVESDAPAVACKAGRGDWQVMGGDSDRRWWSHEIADGSSRSVLLVVYRPDRDLIAEAEERGAREALLSAADVIESADVYDELSRPDARGVYWREDCVIDAVEHSGPIADWLRARAEQIGDDRG